MSRTNWKGRAERLRGRNAELRRMLDDAQGMIAAMKREGFQPPAKIAAPAPAKELPDKVMSALLGRAQPGTSLWRQLTAEALPLIAAGVAADDVAKRILDGEPDPDALLE